MEEQKVENFLLIFLSSLKTKQITECSWEERLLAGGVKKEEEA